jgi:hypothetical protein
MLRFLFLTFAYAVCIFSLSLNAQTLGIPTLLTPANGANIQQRSIAFTWNPVSGASSYGIQLSNVPFATQSFPTGAIGIDTTITTTGIQITFPSGGIPTNTSFYWRVRTNTANFSSDFSPVSTFSYFATTTPQFSVSPSNVNFPRQLEVGQSEDATVVISNASNSPSPVSGTVFNNTGSSDLAIFSGAGQFMLQPGQSRTITVRFKPSVAGAYRSAFTIQFTLPVSATTIPLSATAISPQLASGVVVPSIWATLPTALPAGVRSLFSSASSLFVSTSALGVFRSDDSGATWQPRNTGLTNLVINAVIRNGSIF